MMQIQRLGSKSFVTKHKLMNPRPAIKNLKYHLQSSGDDLYVLQGI